MTFIRLDGPNGLPGSTFPLFPTVRQLASDPSNDPEAAADGLRAAGGKLGDLYIAPDGMLYVLESVAGSSTLVAITNFAGDRGPDGATGAVAHTPANHGIPPARFKAKNYGDLALGPVTTSTPTTDFPVVP